MQFVKFSIVALVLMYYASGCGDFTGPAGAQGPKGDQGNAGQTGPTGPTGVSGTNGSSCSVAPVPANDVAPNGGSLIQCTDGTQSLVLNGTNGTDGQSGTPGTVITPIQFCPGTGSYPSTFPEVGFCVGNSIYAVYSANGGFLTQVLPGTWSSDGINDSCTFTVGPNCQVSGN